MKCQHQNCKEEADCFTDTYDPLTKTSHVIHLCEKHQTEVFEAIREALKDKPLPTPGILCPPLPKQDFVFKSYNNVKGLFDEEPPTFSWDDFKTGMAWVAPLPKGVRTVEGRDAGFIIKSYHIGEEKEGEKDDKIHND